MSKVSSSPDRHTFQKEGYVKRCEEKGEVPNPDYVRMYESWREQEADNLENPEWQKDNMEYDLRSTEWICNKVKASEVYAQHLYAAMCNNDFQKNNVWPILKNQTWSCSWRHSGGIIADMLEEGDYIDWYCSGIKGDGISDEEYNQLSKAEQEQYLKTRQFVGEQMVTDEVRADLLALGWVVLGDD